MSSSLCKLKKKMKKDPSIYIPLVNSPRYLCTKCGRVANKKKNLCEPSKM